MNRLNHSGTDRTGLARTWLNHCVRESMGQHQCPSNGKFNCTLRLHCTELECMFQVPLVYLTETIGRFVSVCIQEVVFEIKPGKSTQIVK